MLGVFFHLCVCVCVCETGATEESDEVTLGFFSHEKFRQQIKKIS